ncbi:Subtilisin-like protease SBT5.6 [Camellia lanceoleosa]|uniref:Subtilisin-like protease SBT5.6 n=1 Tax=Camellia lanceoleosa TaxID=1840588 RepID=A0ACC0GZ06_9ERIC|nr:Subtilisin-like protease SBT5.6 [Camellia lanceoleosa]
MIQRKEEQVYIVYFGEHRGKKTFNEIEETHHSYLFFVKESEEETKSSLLYSYKNSINGFTAVLTRHEASKLSEYEEVVSVFRSKPGKYSLQTIRSWEFVGLEKGEKSNKLKKDDFWFKARYGKEVVVGLLDSGVWPESKSFSDERMRPIPKS